jgi:hypothetical protein
MTDQPGSLPGAGEPPAPPPNPYGSEPPPPPPPPAAYAPAEPPASYAPPAPEAFPPPPVPSAAQQQWSQGAANLQNFDPKSVNPLDWGIIAAGVLAFLFSFFSYYSATAKVEIGGFRQSASAHENAWHGFFGWFAAFVALAAAVVLALHLIAKIRLPFPVRLAVLAGFGLSTLCVLLALLIVPIDTGTAGTFSGVKIDKGHGFGFWLSLIVILAGTGLAFKRFQEDKS